MLIEDFKDYFKKSVNYTSKLNGLDNPNEKHTDSCWWHNYPLHDFQYQYNSWGFRGPEYDQYIGKPVNICIGDSFTINIGGPIEHSWASQLATRFDIPTINLGMDGAGNNAIKTVYNRASEIFDVQTTFIMYSFFHRRSTKNNDLVHIGCLDDNENIRYFEENMIEDVVYTFIPPWCWSDVELDYLQSEHKNNLYNLPNSSSPLLSKLSQKIYNSWKGADWVLYEEFNKGIINETMQNDEEFVKLKQRYEYVNRDGFHMNEQANKIVADFLWSQYNAT